MNTEFQASIKLILYKDKEKKISESKKRLVSYLKDANSYSAEVERRLEMAFSEQRTLDRLHGVDESALLETFTKVYNSPFWEYKSSDASTIKFITREDVIMTEINPAAGVNRSVNLGQYEIVLRPLDGKITLLPHKNNVFSDNLYYHPFCNTAGVICWGTGASLAANLLITQQYDKLFELLAGLLTSFQVGANPYVALHVLENVRNAKKCDYCKHPVDNCECSFCDTCDKREVVCDCRNCAECGDKQLVDVMCPDCFCKSCQKEINCDCCNNCHLTECICCDWCGIAPPNHADNCIKRQTATVTVAQTTAQPIEF